MWQLLPFHICEKGLKYDIKNHRFEMCVSTAPAQPSVNIKESFDINDVGQAKCYE